MASNGQDVDFDVRQENVELYAFRNSLGQNIFTGEPLTGQEKEDWIKDNSDGRRKK